MDPIQFRHHLHQNPDLSGKEYESQKFIKKQLVELGYDSQAIGNTSLILPLSFSEKGKSILIRADFDALPIQEQNDGLSYKSLKPGVSHKCGHDGHAAILFSLAQKIKAKPFRAGKALLLWQASEENGKGAQSVLEDPIFSQFEYDEAFALHNIPGEDLGTILCRSANVTAGVRSISFQFEGLETHAAHPQEGINPASIVSKTLALAEELTNNKPLSEDYAIITPVYATMGARNYGISPAKGEVHFTLRTWSGELLDQLCETLHNQVLVWAKAEGIKLRFDAFEEFWPNLNSEESSNLVALMARRLEMPFKELKHPYSWGEDFGLFTKNKKGAMFGIGSGRDCPVLHHPAYDFPDALIEKASNLFYEILKARLDG